MLSGRAGSPGAAVCNANPESWRASERPAGQGTSRSCAESAAPSAFHAQKAASMCASSRGPPHVKEENILQIVQAGSFPQAGQRVAGQNSALVNDGDPVAELFGLAHDMRREDDGSTVRPKFTYGLLNLQSIQYIETDGRFVEDNDARIVSNGSRYRNLLLHTGGQFFHAYAGILRYSEAGDKRVHSRLH